jgi:hypothetical protein
MSRWSRTLVLVLAFAVMPLHGLAAGLAVLLCHGDAQAHAVHEPDGHDRDAPHDGHHGTQQDDGGASAYHLCCNLTVSVPSDVTVPQAAADLPVRAPSPDSFHDLFIPDRPQRPPLA